MEKVTMNTWSIHRLTICVATLGLIMMSEANAACPGCAVATINANIQVTNLHPSVTAVQLVCKSPGAENLGRSAKLPVVNRGYAGVVTVSLSIPASYVLAMPNYSTWAYCDLWLESSLSPTLKLAAANAAQPLVASDTNWHVVAAGSKVQVSKELKFPNAPSP
jgi:hypothetical protein